MANAIDRKRSISMYKLHLVAVLLRVGLAVYGEWHDKNFDLKFTDVDYHVFTDAAEFVLKGESPYARPTYRYTPLLAWMLFPCHVLHLMWGKLLFIAADIITGILIQNIMEMKKYEAGLVTWAVSLWLFNPITVTISSRGNAESIMSALVIGTLFMLYQKRTILSAVLFSISIHFKIFPLIYAFPIYLFLGSGYSRCQEEITAKGILCDLVNLRVRKLVKTLLSKLRLQYFCVCLLSFTTLTLACYVLYGYDFLENTYLYHITRKDIRHNFSVYFYMLYTNSEWWPGLLCFLNQVIVVLSLSCAFYKDLPFCMFLTTFAFVSFNKVCTSQYFLWYLTLLPLLLPGIRALRKWEVALALFLWGATQSAWLSSAYELEFNGESAFMRVWLASILFFIANVAIMIWFIVRYPKSATFASNGSLKKSNHTD